MFFKMIELSTLFIVDVFQRSYLDSAETIMEKEEEFELYKRTKSDKLLFQLAEFKSHGIHLNYQK